MNAILRGLLCSAVPVVIVACVMAADAIEAWLKTRADRWCARAADNNEAEAEPAPLPRRRPPSAPHIPEPVPPCTDPDHPLTVAEYVAYRRIMRAEFPQEHHQ